MQVDLPSCRRFLDRGDFSDIYTENSKSLAIRWENGRVETVSDAVEKGLGLRCLSGEETRFGHVQEISKLERIHQQLFSALPNRAMSAAQTLTIKKHPIKRLPSDVPLDQKIAVLKKIHQEIGNRSFVRQLLINYGEKEKTVGYINSEGECFLEDRVYTVLSIHVTAEKSGELQSGYESIGGMCGFELFEQNNVLKIAKMVAERALAKLEAPVAPLGEMPVVIAASAGGTLIHEAVGHSLEADAVLEGTSPSYKGKIGHVVGSEKLTVLDDPTVPGARGSFFYDDEGTPSERSVLIEDGVLKTYMYDRISARKDGRGSNGHGRRESYAHRPIPRMSNTIIAPGQDDPVAIVKSLDNGFLVTKMGGGQVNTANGDFVFDVEEGFHVENGKKILVRGATLLGNGPDVLKNIDQVGSDLGWGIGTCGKEGQGVPVSDAMPTVRIKKLVIGGQ